MVFVESKAIRKFEPGGTRSRNLQEDTVTDFLRTAWSDDEDDIIEDDDPASAVNNIDLGDLGAFPAAVVAETGATPTLVRIAERV